MERTRMFSNDQAAFLHRRLRETRNQQKPEMSQSPLTKEEIKGLLLAQNQIDLTNAKKSFLYTFVPMSIALGMELYGVVKDISPMAKVGGLLCLGAELLYIALLTRVDHGLVEETSQELVDSAARSGIA